MKAKKMIATVMAASFVVTGCGNSSSNTSDEIVTEIKEPVEITFWHAMNGGQEKVLTDLTNQFMKENKKIKVNLQNQSSYPDLQQKLTATLPSPKNLPTLTQAYPGWMLNAIKDEQLVDLKPYIEHETLKFDNYDDVLPSFRDGAKIDGKIYGIPFNKSSEVIWYNKTLFDELGLKVPTTFKEFAEVSKTIYEKKGIPGAGFDSLQNYYTTYLKNEGKDLDPKLDVTGKESIAAANYYLDGIKGGYFRIAGVDDRYLSGPFANQQIGMYIGSTAGEGFIKQGVGEKFEYAAARYPAEYSIQQGTDIFMFASATPEQKTAAYTYLKFLTTKENQISWAEKTGYLPIRKSAIDSKEYKSADSILAPILDKVTQKMYVLKNIPGADGAYNEANRVLEGVLSNKDSDVKQAMKAYKETLKTTWE